MTVEVAAIVFVATLVRSTFGFGEALIAVPLLALVIPVKTAAPVAALVSVTVAAVVVAQDWHHVQVRSAAWLIVSTLAGIPVGLTLLTRAPEPAVKALLALVIVAFGLQAMRRQAFHLATDRFAWMFGVAAGVLGGAYGMNGPPLAVYGAMRGWSPSQFRATLQGYFLPASAVGLAGYAVAGIWTPAVTHFYLTSLPAVVVATLAGRLASRRLDVRSFALGVYALLVAVGVVLFAQALTVL